MFQSGFAWDDDLPSVVFPGAQIKHTGGCTGQLFVRNCTLAAATVEYPVRITGSTIGIEPQSTIWGDKIIGPAADLSYHEPAFANGGPSTWAGIALALQNQYNSYMMVEYDPIQAYQVFYEGTAAHTYIGGQHGQITCDIGFSDPMDDMLSSTRELMFRTALSSGAAKCSYKQTSIAVETVARNVCESQYLFLGLATGLSLAGVIAVGLTSNGFWAMGRKTSLSPVETAKAFDAPVLRSQDSNATIEMLLRETGSRQVRYGRSIVSERAVAKTTGTNPAAKSSASAWHHDDEWEMSDLGPWLEDHDSLRSSNHKFVAGIHNEGQQLLPARTGTSGEDAPPDESSHAIPDKDDHCDALLRLRFSSPEAVHTPIVGQQYIG